MFMNYRNMKLANKKRTKDKKNDIRLELQSTVMRPTMAYLVTPKRLSIQETHIHWFVR
jgi:hypothetical protein